ncbi:enoyl-CoA hydratase family protein [Fodinicola feengrottensis]|uniref:enoyl-CoA hydratase family protein n=1 Tax=Fodinicola feengrottensis TaxID=435914 RepID=UPI00244271A0|nr:enoyl-CoA hydratase family protein [Fodinicola feengrottensis]
MDSRWSWTEEACNDEPVSRLGVGFTEEWKHFRLERADNIATLTFNRPDKLNALTFQAYADLRDLLAELPHRNDTRVLVLHGEGRGFCSGGDVNEIIGLTLRMGTDQLLAFTRMTGEVVRAMRECPVPIVAALHGMTAGAGAVLALAADFRIATPSAKFAFLFTKVGLSGADMGAAYLLPRMIGVGRATELLMLGDTLDAETAERYGLVSQLVPEEALSERVTMLARRLADGPFQAYASTKAVISRELDMGLSASLELDATTQALLMHGEDYREFHAAFTGKRPPKWQGR